MRKLFNFLLLLFLFSCYSSRIPNEVIKHIEKEDDNLCIMQGVEFKYQDTKMVYWQCRLRIINQRISGEFDNYGYSLLYKKEFKRLRRIIKNRIREQKLIGIAEIDNSLEEKEHNYCIMLKNQSNYGNVEIYDYFKCRENLANLRKKEDGSKNLSNEYIIKMYSYDYSSINDDQGNTIMIEKDCIKYAYNDKKLKQCQNSLKEIDKCLSNINSQLMQRRIDDKIYCTKVSLGKYPDSLAKFNNYDNNKASDMNSIGPKINKIDMLDLREKEFQKCYKERSLKIISYKDYLENQCRIDNLNSIKKY